MVAQIISGLVEKRSLDRAAADALRQAITTGAITPGTRLTEAELATRLDVSRGTVRAALQRLMSEGLVTQRPYAGWEVARLTSRDAWELYTLRSSLEGLAARLAARNPNRRKPLDAAFDELKVAAKSPQPEADHRRRSRASQGDRAVGKSQAAARSVRLCRAAGSDVHGLVQRASWNGRSW